MIKNNLNENFSELKISYQADSDGFKIFVNGQGQYSVIYPGKIWRPFLKKNILTENFIYSRTGPLGVATEKKLSYGMGIPSLKKIADFGIIGDLPHVGFVNKKNVSGLVNLYKNRKIKFAKTNQANKIVPQKQTSDNKAILALSFGKDSLLTYGLAKELGIKYQLVYVNEMEGEYSIENEHKRKIIKAFIKNEKEKIEYLEDNADSIFYNKNWPVKIQEFDNSNGMLAFALEFLPFAYYHRTKYLILGNEKNLDDFWIQDGYKAYPSFDQSSGYARKLNEELKKFTANNYQVASLVEPIYNLVEMKILYSRYPHLLKYVMSCAQEMTLNDRWCNQCPMCAKAFLYSAAVGGDPKKIGMKHNMFDKKYEQLYPLFNLKNRRAYEMPAQVEQEQLLSFLLAYRNGWHGALIELFKKKYLGKAIKQEKMLRQKFFKIYPMVTVPKHLQTKLLNIYQEELNQSI
ncbi:MAG: hypothetical protein NTX82_00130 [Candidatus Parcubacteria bacterium]|nr:hypothetical protein [Candidatus Parcubacteria bacterium]